MEYYNSHERATGQAILEDRCSALVMHIFEDRCSAVRHCSGLQVKPVLLPPQGNYSTARIANLSALSKTSTLAPNFFCFLRSPANVRMSPEQPTRFHVQWMRMKWLGNAYTRHSELGSPSGALYWAADVKASVSGYAEILCVHAFDTHGSAKSAVCSSMHASWHHCGETSTC